MSEHALVDPAAPSGPSRPVVLEPGSRWRALDLQELWRYRELLYFLVWRDVKVRYKQTALGAAWALLQPLLAMVIFSIVFGRLAGVPSDGVPYPIFAYAALLPWQLFAFSLTESSNSLVGNKNLLTKVYFPRLVIPLASLGVGLVDFSIAFLVLIGMLVYFKVQVTLALLWVPAFVALAVLCALAMGIWFSALNVRYRDVRYVIPFLTQFWLFATPVAYPASLVPDGWRLLYGLNPMVGVVEGFRWAVLGTSASLGPEVWVSVLVVVALLTSGLYYFRRMERTFADIV